MYVQKTHVSVLISILVLSFPSLVVSQAIDNVTLELTYTMENHDTYISGSPVENTKIDAESTFPYIVSETSQPQRVFGIVNFGDFARAGVSINGDTISANLTQSLNDITRGVYLLPFTNNGISAIKNRNEEIGTGLTGGSRFLSRPSPSFSYPISSENTLRAILHYGDDIALIGERTTAYSGLHTLVLTNNGTTDDDRVGVWIRRK